jgi:hypothetical protein
MGMTIMPLSRLPPAGGPRSRNQAAGLAKSRILALGLIPGTEVADGP